jgi:hypothetical protein
MAPKQVKIVLKEEGSLSRYGYHVKDTREDRRKALRRVFKDRKSRVGLNQLIGRINVLSIYFKNKNPLYAARADEDEKYVRAYRDEHYPLNTSPKKK